MSETDKLSEMGIDSVRAASLAAATLAPRQVNGITKWSLQSETGEWFYSFCSSHWDHDANCPRCHTGMFGW